MFLWVDIIARNCASLAVSDSPALITGAAHETRFIAARGSTYPSSALLNKVISAAVNRANKSIQCPVRQNPKIWLRLGHDAARNERDSYSRMRIYKPLDSHSHVWSASHFASHHSVHNFSPPFS
jgi:hypothetical protein